MTYRRVLLALPAGLLLIAGCSTGSGSQAPKTVVVTRTATAPATSTSSGPTGSTAPSSATSPSVSASTMRQLPGTCDDLLPEASVDNALGRSLGGQTAFVVGLPEKDIGRIGYLNCRYGLPLGTQNQDATPKVEIGISLYGTAALAAARVPATVDDYVAHNATSAITEVSGRGATILTGGMGAGYTEPTLVLASGQRTVAVTVYEAAGARATKDLTALAALALQQTGG